MRIKKSKNPQEVGKGAGFVIYKAEINRNRSRVARLIGSLNCLNLTSFPIEVFDSEAKLVEHAQARIEFSALKRQMLGAIQHVLGPSLGNVVVGGAREQLGGGSRTTESRLSGLQAGHIAIGTYWATGDSVTRRFYSGIEQQALRQQIPKQDIAFAYPALAAMAGEAFYLDGATSQEPAFVNQTWNLVETPVFPYLNAHNLSSNHKSESELRRFLTADGTTIANILATHKRVLIGSIKERLLALRHDKSKDILQDPEDRANQLFDGEGRRFLEALLSQLEDPESQFQRKQSLLINRIEQNAQVLSEVAVEAYEEREGDAPEVSQPNAED
jgi:hypothetical protein